MKTKPFALMSLGLAALLAGSGAASAHYVWVVVERGDGPGCVQVGLGETPDTIDSTLAEKIAGTQVQVDGRPVELTRGDDGLEADPGAKAPAMVEASCDYGVIERQGKTYPLTYTARAQARPVEAGEAREEGLDLIWVEGDGGSPEVLATWRGEPLAGAELKVFAAAGEPVEAKADARGRLAVPGLAEGRAALMVRHVEAASGNRDGKSFDESRCYATLTVAPEVKAASDAVAQGDDEGGPEADAMLRQAHDARANWGPGFPGFTADLTVRVGEDEIHRGHLRVSPEGEVSTDLPDGPATKWAERHLSSVVMHRGLQGPTSLEPGAKFLDADASTHPLGRLIELAGVGMGSAYRVKGDDITEVSRTMGLDRFTNRVLANSKNAEGKLLPMVYTVAHWNDETGEVTRVETYLATWTRVGRLDLPASQTLVLVGDDTSEVRQLELTNHRLLDDEATTASAP